MVKALIIDSDLEFRRTLRLGLELADITVSVAADAQAAVDKLDQAPHDIIITELVLPDHNGLALLQHLQSYSDWQQIPIIVLTQLSPERIELSEQEWRQYGVVAHIYKPELDLQQLQQRLTVEASRAA